MRPTILITAALVSIPALACSVARGPTSLSARPPGPTSADSVSIGYGKQARNSVTGSMAVLEEKDLERTRAVRVEELLQGRVAGVQVLRTSRGTYSIRIRGTSSILGSNEPLIVLDGLPLAPDLGAGSAMFGIVPQDVARIEVLKDAAATAIYGVRGGNGVIVITTKRSR